MLRILPEPVTEILEQGLLLTGWALGDRFNTLFIYCSSGPSITEGLRYVDFCTDHTVFVKPISESEVMA